MSFLLGSKNQDAKPQYTGIQLQTSSSVLPVPLFYGMSRGAANLIWFGDFKAIPQETKTGKGFGGSQITSYLYSASVQMALCEGGTAGITGIARAWADKAEYASYTALGFTLFPGTIPQTPWPFLTAEHAAQSLGYPGTAYVCQANYGLGSSASLPNHNFEIQGLLYNTQVDGAGDADPALMTQDFLTDDDHGARFPDAMLDSAALLSGPDATTTGDSAFQTYCRAMGFGLSPALVQQETGLTILDRWTTITNTAMCWTGSSLKLIPYGDEVVTAHGVTYLPPTEVCYAIGDADYRQDKGEDPITVSRSDPSDAYNRIDMTIRDRNNAYNQVPAPWFDDNAISLYGLKENTSYQALEICEPAIGVICVALYGQRQLYNRKTYKFGLTPQYDLLEPMDVITVSDPKIGTVAVRLTEIDEDDNDWLMCTAEEFTGALGSAAGASMSGATPTPINSGADPGPVNDPVLLEPPSTLTGGPAQVWAAVSGADPLWGGAFVWLSTDAGSTYPQQIGKVIAPATQGVTTSDLAAYGGSNPDTGHSVGVDLSMSHGTLTGAAAADAAAGATLSWLDGEYLSYEDATLVSANHYTLTTALWRGLYGSAAASHLTGVQFARLDGAIFKYDLPPSYIGATLYLKFQSFNIWGSGLEDLSTCTGYPVTPDGTGYGGGTGGVPLAPTGLTATPLAAGVFLTWSPNAASDNVTSFDVYRAPGTGASFGSASFLAPVTGQAFNDTSAAAASYTYFIVAKNTIGSSDPSAGANAVASLSGALWGFGFERDLSAGTLGAAFVDFVSKVPWTMPIGLPLAAIWTNGTGPTAQTDFDLVANGVSVGTARFAAAATEATFIKAAATSVLADQPTSIVLPSNLNGMTGRMFGAVVGTR